jgi:peptide/nickel transport system permease protein
MTSTVSLDRQSADPAPPRPRASGLARLMPSLSPKLVVGLAIAGVIILWAIIGPMVVRDPNAISARFLAHPFSHGFILGSTQAGQDVFAQIAWGTRGSLEIGFTVGIAATVCSAVFGVLGAYLGGLVDEVFALFTNVMLVIPGLPLAIVIGNYVPQQHRGVMLIALILAITGWAASARVLRAVTLSLRNRDYVVAARVSGELQWRILLVEILPNLIPVMASQFIFSIIFAILGEAGLSFLGLGANGTFTLGTILYTANQDLALTQGAWWWFIPPGLIIALFGAALSMINFSIDEIINPKLRGSTRAARKKWGLTASQIRQLEEENVR